MGLLDRVYSSVQVDAYQAQSLRREYRLHMNVIEQDWAQLRKPTWKAGGTFDPPGPEKLRPAQQVGLPEESAWSVLPLDFQETCRSILVLWKLEEAWHGAVHGQ